MKKHFRFQFLFLLILSLIAAQNAVAHPGVGILQDSKGNVFYTDLEHVWKISPDGRKSIAVKNVHTHELYLDSQDNLFGEHVRYEGEKTDRYHHRIWRRSPDGKVTDVIKERSGFRDDLGFVRDSNGNQYWISFQKKTSAIRKRTAAGKIATLKTDKPLGHLSFLAVSPEGSSLYVTSGTGLYRISSSGKTTPLLPEPQSKNQTLLGVFVGKDGSIYVADYGQNAIKKVEKSGLVTVVAKSSAPWGPAGLFISANKDLWVLEYSTSNQARVRIIAANGKETLF